ncbi:Protein of unknown function [Pyronema omphalodes CBS 100304]|uniref:Uncharacterized protein n=1 Tax=Pyronema omphalodes (strain CBS 100304) TaxID=1076935 RepID=U4KXU3_PYROM|nr:Protein of unknown function [Pyronema omphalodes CBS 100304]
MYGIMVAVGSR